MKSLKMVHIKKKKKKLKKVGHYLEWPKGASLVVQRLKHLPAMSKTWVRFLVREDPLEKEMATHSSILAWRIPWREEPGRLQSTGSQRVGHNWATSLSLSLSKGKSGLVKWICRLIILQSGSEGSLPNTWTKAILEGDQKTTIEKGKYLKKYRLNPPELKKKTSNSKNS